MLGSNCIRSLAPSCLSPSAQFAHPSALFVRRDTPLHASLTRPTRSTRSQCNLECVATKPPTISAACQALHPCAKLAETLCVGVLGPKESILDCMKKHRAKLTPKCIRSEPCLQVGNPRCSSHHHHYMGNAFERNQLFGETHPNDKCSCGVSSPCSEHLNHPFCEPCGKDCVRNPQCGGGKTWCEVKSSSCNSALTHHMGECIGPYIGFPHCESEILHLIVKRHQISRMNADIDIRCSVQAELARMSPSKCPLPRKSLPGFLAQKRIRHCSTGPKHHHHPPLFGSFLRDIFGGARRESKLRHQRTALEKERVALALERRGMARERLERRSVDKELVHEIEASTAEAKKSKWEARAAEAKARMFNAEAVRSYERFREFRRYRVRTTSFYLPLRSRHPSDPLTTRRHRYGKERHGNESVCTPLNPCY